MLGLPCHRGKKAQISLEFLIVYSFVLIIFIIMFALIATQRAAALVQQQYSLLQSQAQAIATYINQAVSSGNGYSVTLPLLGGFVSHSYNLSISSTGVVILGTKSGSQPITAYAFSNAKNFVINGTLLQSANGISIYQLQTYKGSVSIYNSKGIIYIDQQPASTTNLAQGTLASQQADVKDALFNGVSSYISTGRSGFSIGSNGRAEFAWVYYTGSSSSGNYYTIFDYGRYNGGGLSGIGVNGGYLTFMLGGTNTHSLAMPTGAWSFVGFSYVPGSTTANMYLNGNEETISVNGGSPLNTPSPNFASIGGDITGAPALVNPFSGSIADVQVYNASLSPIQVNALYANGISAAPILSANSVGWWPLNGNADDYSGYSNQGSPNVISYGSVLQLNAQLLPSSNSLIEPIAGFVASEGSLGYNSLSEINYTNSNSIAHAFLSSNGASGSGNVIVDFFNGNTSTQGNLVGWWPLDTGYGNVAYDLSGQYNNGAFSNVVWSSTNRTDFAAASFPGDTNGVSNSNTQDGFITVNSAQSLLGIAVNSTFTTVGWIYYKGATPSHCQGIFGDWPNPGAGFQLVGSEVSGCALLYVSGNTVQWPGSVSAFPANTWEMVTAQYNGSTGLADVYLNSTLFASNVLPKNIGLVQVQPLYIGDDASQPGGLDSFNGLITNLQLYSSYLTQSQISALYAQGPASTPLGNSGLISWWPLAGNTKDYSFNNNTGAVQYNVTFRNGNYTNSQHGARGFATFNGQTTSYIKMGQVDSIAGNQISLFAWINPSGIPNAFPTIVSKNGVAGDYQLGLGQSGASFNVRPCSTAFGCQVSNGAIQLNGWSYIGFTYDGSNLRIYINGVLDKTISASGVLPASSDQLVVGASSLLAWPFQGSIANVQIYNSVLTQQQVMQLYADGLPPQSKLNVSLG